MGRLTQCTARRCTVGSYYVTRINAHCCYMNMYQRKGRRRDYRAFGILEHLIMLANMPHHVCVTVRIRCGIDIDKEGWIYERSAYHENGSGRDGKKAVVQPMHNTDSAIIRIPAISILLCKTFFIYILIFLNGLT